MRFPLTHHRILASTVLAAAACPNHAAAITLSAPPKADNTLYESATGDVSNGAGQHFFAGTTATSIKRRGVLAFEIPLAIAPGTTVDSAAVVLFMSRAQPGTYRVALHRLIADWGEGTSDAALEEGAGTASSAGDATWIHRFYDTQAWTTPGGDFVAAASATIDVGDVGFYSWSSLELLADVQAWVDAPASNFGWLLLGDESVAGSAKRFDSRENPDPNRRPQLLLFLETPTNVREGSLAFRLHPGAPNPFHQRTTIAYELPSVGHVALRLLDARGRQMRSFAAPSSPGHHFLTWDGDDATGRPLPAGKYFLILEAGGARRVQSLVLSR